MFILFYDWQCMYKRLLLILWFVVDVDRLNGHKTLFIDDTMVVVDTFVFCFFFIKYNHSSVDTVVFRYRYTCWNHSCCWYLGGFFLSIVTTLLLMRLLNLWIVYCFFTLNVLVFRCCVQSFCCPVDELMLRGVLTVVLW